MLVAKEVCWDDARLIVRRSVRVNQHAQRNGLQRPAGEPYQASAPSEDATALNLSGLLDLDWQKGLVIMLTLLVGLALMWVLWQVISPIQQTLILFGLGAVVAFALSGPVDMLMHHVGNRGLSILIVYVLVGTLVLGGSALLAG